MKSKSFYRQLKVSQLQGHLSYLDLEEWKQFNTKEKICLHIMNTDQCCKSSCYCYRYWSLNHSHVYISWILTSVVYASCYCFCYCYCYCHWSLGHNSVYILWTLTSVVYASCLSASLRFSIFTTSWAILEKSLQAFDQRIYSLFSNSSLIQI